MKDTTQKSGAALTAENIKRTMEENPFAKLGDVVYESIEGAILSSVLAPGQKLNLSKIAEKLEVSTSPVRDALDRLCSKGLVVNTLREDAKYSSYYVFDISNDTISDLYCARKTVECMAVSLCAQKNWNVDMVELERLATDFKDTLETYAKNPRPDWDFTVTSSLDRAFHKLLIQSTKNQYLIEMYSSMEKYLDYVSMRRSEFLREERNMDKLRTLAGQHMAIFNAVKFGFSDMARTLMEKHIDSCTDRILQNRS